LDIGQNGPDAKTYEASYAISETARVAEITSEGREPIFDTLDQSRYVIVGNAHLAFFKL